MNQKRGLNRFSKLPDDGDPWAPNNLLTPEQKKNTSWTPGSSGPNQLKRIALSRAIIESDARPTGVQLKKAALLSTMIGLKLSMQTVT